MVDSDNIISVSPPKGCCPENLRSIGQAVTELDQIKYVPLVPCVGKWPCTTTGRGKYTSILICKMLVVQWFLLGKKLA